MSDSSASIRELQMLEQQLQSTMMQKQTLQVEHNECKNALHEVSKTSGDVFRVLGGIMMKADKPAVIKELEQKEKELALRLTSFDKQMSAVEDKITALQKQMSKEIASKK